jgi:hypothetical protein
MSKCGSWEELYCRVWWCQCLVKQRNNIYVPQMYIMTEWGRIVAVLPFFPLNSFFSLSFSKHPVEWQVNPWYQYRRRWRRRLVYGNIGITGVSKCNGTGTFFSNRRDVVTHRSQSGKSTNELFSVCRSSTKKKYFPPMYVLVANVCPILIIQGVKYGS